MQPVTDRNLLATIGLARPAPDLEPSAGVAGNARLTGATGAILFVLLAIEGVTILRVHALISAHVFVGMLMVPVVVLKTASTGYRFVHYYRGDEAYVRKGAPPLVLRVLGPLVVVLTLAVLATGIAAGALGPPSHRLVMAHKVSFILWFGAMTVHVIGHFVETAQLAADDITHPRAVPGAGVRFGLVIGALVAGALLAFATHGWVAAWRGIGG
jgi:hypothetical protein